VLHAADGHDGECCPTVVAHDPDAHVFKAGSEGDSDGGHCVACHAARSFRLYAGRIRLNVALVPHAGPRERPIWFPATLLVPHVATRAPPFSLV
jgi:hypothetical protein